MGRPGAWGGVNVGPDERLDPDPSAPWSADAEPEPAWADAIRRGRKARGNRLRAVFDSFDDDDPTTIAPSRPAGAKGDGS
jgi:hypothetical protein